jgi:hypothetical protein
MLCTRICIARASSSSSDPSMLFELLRRAFYRRHGRRSMLLSRVSRIDILRLLLFALRCHFSGAILPRHAARSQLFSLQILFRKFRLASIDRFSGHIVSLNASPCVPAKGPPRGGAKCDGPRGEASGESFAERTSPPRNPFLSLVSQISSTIISNDFGHFLFGFSDLPFSRMRGRHG